MLWLLIFQLSALQLDPMARLLVLAIAALAVLTVRLLQGHLSRFHFCAMRVSNPKPID